MWQPLFYAQAHTEEYAAKVAWGPIPLLDFLKKARENFNPFTLGGNIMNQIKPGYRIGKLTVEAPTDQRKSGYMV